MPLVEATLSAPSDPSREAFFLGRTLVRELQRAVGETIADRLSDFGIWEAEYRQTLQQFVQEVIQQTETDLDQEPVTAANPAAVVDLQAVLDDLRAEIAATRFALQQYRQTLSD